ncbi:MAG: NAD-binding protein [Actinomycetales bacterium]|nr:NAD-binding protein [Actinomycetales bacterium]
MSDKVLVIGHTDIGRRTCAALEESGVEVIHLPNPSDSELREVLTETISGVAVMLHNDIEALRYSLTIQHVKPGIKLFVAIFDRSVRHELERTIPNCFVASPAYISGATILASALTSHDAIVRTGPTNSLRWQTLDLVDESAEVKAFQIPTKWRMQRLIAIAAGQLRSYDFASRALLTGFLALVSMLVIDAIILSAHTSLPQAFYSAAAVIAGVTAPEIPHAGWQFIQSGSFMLLTIIFIAMFGAGIVNHILHGRRIGIVGRRVIPLQNHIVIVGLGQVGIRLCKELTLLKVPVVAIEQSEHARGVQLARDLNIPVIIGNASDIKSLRQARVGSAKALLAMASIEQDNISVAVAARTLFPNTQIIMRAGTNDAIEETRSLFSIGQVSDVNGLTAAYVADSLVHEIPKVVIQRSNQVLLVGSDSKVRTCASPGRCSCD